MGIVRTDMSCHIEQGAGYLLLTAGTLTSASTWEIWRTTSPSRPFVKLELETRYGEPFVTEAVLTFVDRLKKVGARPALASKAFIGLDLPAVVT